MCGRFMLAASPEALSRLLDVPPAELPSAPRYNIAPTQPVLICRRGRARPREVALVRWGLVPSWAREPSLGARLINARAETAAEKPAFRRALAARRCLVPADGFFEWTPRERGRRPYLFRAPDGEPFAMAGLWERWTPRGGAAGGAALSTCAILTRPADERVARVHERMPVIVPAGRFDDWLDPQNPGGPLLAEFLAGPTPIAFEARAVSPRVNDPRNDDPSCVAPL